MPKSSNTGSKPKSQPRILKGWKQIVEFLGEPVSVTKRCASEGNAILGARPIRHQFARAIERLDRPRVGKPVQVVSSQTELTSESRRGIAFARHDKKTEEHREDDVCLFADDLTF
jgi:hypothetical protein